MKLAQCYAELNVSLLKLGPGLDQDRTRHSPQLKLAERAEGEISRDSSMKRCLVSGNCGPMASRLSSLAVLVGTVEAAEVEPQPQS